jgi:hypothetical protein
MCATVVAHRDVLQQYFNARQNLRFLRRQEKYTDQFVAAGRRDEHSADFVPRCRRS